ncbi:transglutaminaseTgpA domain-containing protein [Streptomyces sp. CA-135486]|uniref:DUF3488 and transglutaminase-like domain-containing protein n=1 Tax=Streptomyces sp. CA-135486 TaxID=3240049 RepID=UPI003D8AA679
MTGVLAPVTQRPAAGRAKTRDGHQIAAPLFAGAAAWSAGLAFHRAFGLQPLLLPLTVAALTPALCTAALAWRRSRPPVERTLSASVALGVFGCAIVLFGGAEDLTALWPALRATGGAALDGWARLLSTGLPAPDDPVLLTFPFLTTWLASAVGSEAALRVRVRAVACLPATVLMVTAVACCVPGEASVLPQALAFTASLGLLLGQRPAVRRLPVRAGNLLQRPTAIRLSGATAAAWIAVLAAVAAGVTQSMPWLHGDNGYDVRDRFRAPVHAAPAVDPLAQLPRWQRSPRQHLFTVTGGAPDRWRLCTLTLFNGERWSLDGAFVPTGGSIPSGGPSLAPSHRTWHNRVVVNGLDGSFLPVPARPFRVTGPALAANPQDGTVMTVDHLGPGTAYTVDSTPPARPPQFRLPALRAGSTRPAALDVPPGSPTALQEFTRGVTTGTHAPYARATAIATRLRTSYTHLPGSPGLPSYGGIARFLQDKQGPPALFATVFALAARSSGLPARLVVGFTPRAAGTDAPHQVRGGDARVWNEVYFADAGWVPFDPVPPAGRARNSAAEPPPSSAKPRPSQASQNASPSPANPPKSVRPVPRALPSTHLRDVGALIAVLCSLLAAALYGARALRLVVLPAVRSRRARRVGPPAERARGAWRSAVDCLGDTGVRIGPSADVTQISRLMAETAGPDAVVSTVALARTANRALYDEPDSGENDGGRPYLAEEDADRAWDRSDQVCAALRRRAGRLGGRMWLLVLPRPLLVRWRRSRIGRLSAPALSDDATLRQTPAGRATG